ncbi:MAG: hypothetical protein L0216_09155 [Planctomycetales bacterium]|nr:hypothetical protein [Planctomycetales bacterium]
MTIVLLVVLMLLIGWHVCDWMYRFGPLRRSRVRFKVYLDPGAGASRPSGGPQQDLRRQQPPPRDNGWNQNRNPGPPPQGGPGGGHQEQRRLL